MNKKMGRRRHLARLVMVLDDWRISLWLMLAAEGADWGTGGPEFKSRRSDHAAPFPGIGKSALGAALRRSGAPHQRADGGREVVDRAP